ncbi:MAG: hypothetical protein ACK5DJ_05470 [Bacteroidota bacterium]
MKRLLSLSIAIISLSSGVVAQQNKVVSAWNYYKPEYDLLDKARTNIDEASVHESTMGKAKTWYYRGLIYQKIYKHPKYGNLDEMALEKAFESYKKALELEPNYENKDVINQNLEILAGNFFARGLDEFNAKTFDKSLNSFQWVLKISPNDSKATLNSALCAERVGKLDVAKGYYASLVTAKQADANVFLSLSSILRKENNIDGALTTIIEGRKSFPENNPLMIEQLNIYLSTGREKEASEFIDMAIQSDPSNASLYFAKGTLNDKQGKKDVAEMAYKKAIELNGNYFEAYYNLGAMHFNTAAEMVNKANDIPPNKIADYEAAKKKFEAKFREAVPYLEKALELSPKDVSTMESLKQIYTKLNQLDKASEMKKRIEASK